MIKKFYCHICQEYKNRSDLKLRYNPYLFKRKICCKKCNLFPISLVHTKNDDIKLTQLEIEFLAKKMEELWFESQKISK